MIEDYDGCSLGLHICPVEGCITWYRVKNLHMNVDHSPYDQITVRGYPLVVTQRGKIIVKGGQFVGEVGAGRFLKRKRIEI